MAASRLISYLQDIPTTTWVVLATVGSFWYLKHNGWNTPDGHQRAALNWTLVDGTVFSTEVNQYSGKSGQRGGYKAVLWYSYYSSNNSEPEYQTGVYVREFEHRTAASTWSEPLKNKRIPVRILPHRTDRSLVLASELDQRYAPPVQDEMQIRGTLNLLAGGNQSRLPARFRPPTEIAAYLAGICFLLSLIDHLCRLIAGRPAYPYLSSALWGVLVLIGFPFWYWANEKLDLSILSWPGKDPSAPLWQRVTRSMIDLYAGFNWLIPALRLDQFLPTHARTDRFDPYSNGVFLILIFGNATAILFEALNRIEDPSNPCTWSVGSQE